MGEPPRARSLSHYFKNIPLNLPREERRNRLSRNISGYDVEDNEEDIDFLDSLTEEAMIKKWNKLEQEETETLTQVCFFTSMCNAPNQLGLFFIPRNRGGKRRRTKEKSCIPSPF